jgi:hypothetical protein
VFVEKIINSIKDQDYEAFIANGDKGFSSITKSMFEGVCASMERKFKDGHELTYFGDLKARGYQVTLWRVSFKNGSDDSLGRISVKNGKVGGFIIQ